MAKLNDLPELPKTQNLSLDLIDLEDLGITDELIEKDIFQPNSSGKNLDELLDEEFKDNVPTDENSLEYSNDNLIDDFEDFDEENSDDDFNLDDIDFDELSKQDNLEDIVEEQPIHEYENENNIEENEVISLENDFSSLDDLDLDNLDTELNSIFEETTVEQKPIDKNKNVMEPKAVEVPEIETLDIEEPPVILEPVDLEPVEEIIEEIPTEEEIIVEKENEPLVKLDDSKVTWFKGLQNKYISSISHSFLLDFNTKDYIVGRENLEAYITEYAAIGSFDIVIKYDLANGLQFVGPNPDLSKQNFLNDSGLNDKKTSLETDELYMALNDNPVEDDEPAIPNTPLDVFSLIAPLFKQESEIENNGRILLYLNAIDLLLPDAPIAQMSINDRKLLMLIEEIASSAEADAHNNLLIMVANNGQDVHNSLKRASTRIEKINLPLPSKEARLEFIEEELIEHQGLGNIFDGNLTPTGLSNLSAGLSKMQIEDIAFRAVSDESANGIINDKLVRERKTDIIKAEYEDVIEIIDSDITFADIGGMEKIKEYFMEEVIAPIRSNSDELWMVPLGVMFLGPAGTGKTLLAQAVAKESQMNCVNLNIAKILNKYVGASEKNFEKALQCISSMEPTIVIVEEIDNVFNGRGNDSSGVGGRLFKRFLEFMSDTTRRGKVIVIATSNYPSRMDAALKRPGRFDKKIPFLVPEKTERLSIINVLCKRKGFRFEIADAQDFSNLKQAPAEETKEKLHEMSRIIETTEGMTGAELETIVQKAITYTYRDKRDVVSINDIYRATTVVIPSTSAIQEMTAEALIECNDLDFIPEKYRAYAKKLKEKLVQKAPAVEPGSVNG